MRVLHVIPSVAERYGGPSQLIIAMCRALQADGIEVEIATTNADGDRVLSVELGSLQLFKGVGVRFFKRQFSEAYKYSAPLAAWLRKSVVNYDLVHIHAVFSHSCMVAAKACLDNNVPYLMRPLGTLDPWSIKQKPWRKRIFLACGGTRALENASSVHYSTQLERQRTEARHGLDNGVVIANAVDSKLFDVPLDPVVFGQHFSELEPGQYLLFMGRLHSKKNIEALISAFEKVWVEQSEGSLKLVIAGSGSDEYVQKLTLMIETSTARNNIVMPGWVSDEYKRSLLKGAKLFVLPSKNENYGIAVAEALASGVPVVVSDQVYLHPQITRARCGWVWNPKHELAAVLTEALSSQELAQIGKRGARLADQQLSWPAVSRQLVDQYQELTHNPGSDHA